MATPAERFKGWIESLGDYFSDKLKGWMISWTFGGIVDALEVMTPEEVSILEALPQQFIDDPNTSPELKAFLQRFGKRGHPLIVIAGVFLGIMMLIPMVTGAFQSIGKLWSHTQERKLSTYRLDPMAVITAWRRDPAKYGKFLEDLKDQGFTPDRIDAFDFATKAYPALQDVIMFYAKEAFEPDMIEKYGLGEEPPPYEGTLFEKLGVPKPIADLYWIAHWEHASFGQMMEMLHRGMLTGSKEVPPDPVGYEEWKARDAQGEEEMYQWYRLVEVPPIWRKLLTASLWNVPTRVDVRRFWDMRTIDEEELISIYHRQGYHGKDLENYIRWTKVYTDFPMKMAHFTNGWITEDDIRAWLRGLEIPEDRIEDFIREKTKPAKAERVADDKKLTMALIVEGVKKGVITEAEGIDLLMDLGYDADEAEYIIRVRVETAAGSPENMEQFRDITQKYRKAVGTPAKPVSELLKKAADEKVRVTKEVEDLRRLAKEERDKLADDEILPKEATARFDEVTLALHRAEAELFRVTADYNSLLAEWKQQEAK